MGKHWTTSTEQLEWLRQKIPDYHEAQKKKSVDRFLSQCQSAWFEIWPMRSTCFPEKSETDPLTSEEQTKLAGAISERKKQIMWWYQWNGNPTRHSDKRDVSAFVKALGLQQKKSSKSKARRPQRVVIYQRLYSDKVKVAVEEEIKKVGAKLPAQQLKIRREMTQTMLVEEPAEVHAKIDDELRKWDEDREKELQQNEEEGEGGERTAEDYHSAVMALPEVLKNALSACAEVTGWVFHVVAAGPYGLDNGSIWQQEYYFGPKNAAGCDFKEAYVDYEKGFYHPFSKHVWNCFPADVRASRAVQKKPVESNGTNMGITVPNPSEGPEEGPESTGAPGATEEGPESTGAPGAAEEGPELRGAPGATESRPESTAPGATEAPPEISSQAGNDNGEDDDDEPLAGLVASLRNNRASDSAIFSTQNVGPPHAPIPSRSSIFVSGSNPASLTEVIPPPPPHAPSVSPPLIDSSNHSICPGDMGGPSEPIAYAFARMRGDDLPGLITGNTNNVMDPRMGTPSEIDPPVGPGYQISTSVNPCPAVNNDPPIDPVLQAVSVQPTSISNIQLSQAPPTFSDYTIPGARINDGLSSSPEEPDHHEQMQSAVPLISNVLANRPSMEPVLSVQEKRRQTMEANKLKRKRAEIENELAPAGDQRARRVVRPPKRPDASPEKKTTAEGKKAKKGGAKK